MMILEIAASSFFHGQPVGDPTLNMFGYVPFLKVEKDFLVIIARVYQLS